MNMVPRDIHQNESSTAIESTIRRRLLQIAGGGITGLAGCTTTSNSGGALPSQGTNSPSNAAKLTYDVVSFDERAQRLDVSFAPLYRVSDTPLGGAQSTASISIPQSDGDVRIDGWNGDADCSATAHIGYDADNFYFEATVTDDAHSASEGSGAWRGDSVQVAFAANGDYGPEYTFAHLEDDVVVHKSRSNQETAGAAAVSLETTRGNSETTYRAAIPWNAIQESDAPRTGHLPFAFIVNDNDGDGREGWIQWTGAIGDNKKPDNLATVGVEPENAAWTAWMDGPSESFVGRQTTASVYVPNYTSEAIELSVALPTAGVESGRLDLPGRSIARIPVTVTPEEGGSMTIEAVIESVQGDASESLQLSVDVLDVAALRSRFDEIESGLPDLEALLERADRNGVPTDYPRVTTTVIERFLQYGRADIDNDYIDRASYVVDQLERMSEEVQSTLEAALDGDGSVPEASRYRTGPIEVDGQGFAAPKTNPDGEGTERGSVFFSGYGHFAQVREDVPNFQDFGNNLIQTGFGPRSTIKPVGMQGWQTRRFNDVEATLERDTSVSRSGSASYKITHEQEPEPQHFATLWQNVEVTPGTTYDVTAWVKGENAGSTFFTIDSADGWGERHQFPTGTFDWQRVEFSFTPAEGDSDVGLRYVCGNPTDAVWIDDVTVSSADGDENLLENPGFETGEQTPERSFRVDQSAIDPIEDLLERGAEHDVAVNLNIAPHYFPEWAMEKWPDLAVEQYGAIDHNINHPKAEEILEAHIRATMERIKSYDSLHSICLSNEPHYNANDETYTKPLWEAYLADTHESIDQLNERYGTDYDAYSAVPMLGPEKMGSTDVPNPHQYDWNTFLNERFAEFHEWMAEVIHDVAPDVPVHAKMMGNYFYWRWHESERGLNPELFAEFCDINGNDNFNWSDEGPKGFFQYNQFTDYQTSMRDAPVYNSENHLIKNGNGTYNTQIADHVGLSLWQGAIHGQSASTMWVWSRYHGQWDTFEDSILHRPVCVEAVGKRNLDANRLAGEVTAFQDAPSSVAILYTPTSNVYSARHKPIVNLTYRAASEAGVEVDVVSEEIAQNDLGTYDVVVIPDATNVAPGTVTGVAEYIDSGGTTVVVGEDSLSADAYDTPHSGQGLQRVMDAATVLPKNAPDEEIRAAVTDAVETAGIREVTVHAADSGEIATGIEWRSIEHDGRRLVNIANYTSEELSLAVQMDGDLPDSASDLLSGRRVDPSGFTLAAKTPLLLSFE
jgi:hypothetical protein